MQAAPLIRDDCHEILEDIGPRFDLLAGTTVLVTGASGFLCSYLVDSVACYNDASDAPDCRVIALDNMLTGRSERLSHLLDRPDIRFVNHDVSAPLDLDEPIDWIIHGASIASPSVYRQYPLQTIDANVEGTRRMLELARDRDVKGMLVMSTSEVYGDPDPKFIPTPETYNGNVSCTGPRACYDESKRLAETLSMTYYREYGLPVILIRPFNVYGPGLRLDDQRVLPDFMSAVLRNEPIVLFSDGRPTRTFCYVSDAIGAMWRLLLSKQGGEAYNVGNHHGEISTRDLAELVSRIGSTVTDSPPVEVKLQVSSDSEYLTDNPQRRCPDTTKLRANTDWVPKVSLEEGLRRTLVSYRQLGLVGVSSTQGGDAA